MTFSSASLVLVPSLVLALAVSGGQAQHPAKRGMARAKPQVVTLAAKNDSGITGSATLTRTATSLHVRLHLKGLKAGTTYPAHIHQGTCDAGGSVAAPLQSIKGVAGGTGASSTTVPITKLEKGKSYFIQAHMPDMKPAACGDIPSKSGM